MCMNRLKTKISTVSDLTSSNQLNHLDDGLRRCLVKYYIWYEWSLSLPMLCCSIVRAISFSSMHGPDAFSHLLMNTMNHIQVHIYTVLVSPLLKSAMKKLQAVATAVDIFMDQRLATALQGGETWLSTVSSGRVTESFFVCRITNSCWNPNIVGGFWGVTKKGFV